MLRGVGYKRGRKLGGGFRIGVMERDVILAHGAPAFAKDRLMEQSDETRVWFCRICGLQSLVIAGDAKSGIPPRRECRLCETNKVFCARMPYATKLLIEEFAGMNVIIRVLPVTTAAPGEKLKIMKGKKKIGDAIIDRDEE